MNAANPYAAAVYRRNRLAVLEAAGWRCQMMPGCLNRATTADHIIPLVAGGGHDLANLRAACWAHNSAGGARITNSIKAARRVGRRSRRW